MGSDGKIHFTNGAGADTALNFKQDLTYKDIATDISKIVTISNSSWQYNIQAKDIAINCKILAAGAMSRPHDGWCAFNVTYDEKNVTIKWVNNKPMVNWVIRVWYIED